MRKITILLFAVFIFFVGLISFQTVQASCPPSYQSFCGGYDATPPSGVSSYQSACSSGGGSSSTNTTWGCGTITDQHPEGQLEWEMSCSGCSDTPPPAASCGGGAYCGGAPVTPDPSPAGTTVCGNNNTPYTCNPNGDSVGDWVAGSGPCYTAACPAPSPAVCSNAHYGCAVGTLSGTGSETSSFFIWTCDGPNGGTDAQCMESIIAGQCASTHYNCNAGVPRQPGETSTAWTWRCDSPNSSNGGPQASCSETKPINGVCGYSSAYACSSGDSVNNGSNATAWTWDCLGSNGGTSMYGCTYNKPAMSGSISTSPGICYIGAGQNTCLTSVTWSTTNPQGTSSVTSNQSGSATGNSGTQSFPVHCRSNSSGGCGDIFYLYNNGVLLGQATGFATCDSNSTWSDSSNSCVANPPLVNGACSSTHYGCSSGDSTGTTGDTSTVWNWSCNGSGGGTNASCSENKPPVNSPSGSISATSCTIGTGSSTCNSSVTWSTSNLAGGSSTAVTHNNPNNTTVSSATSGTNVSATVNFGSTSFFLYNNGSPLASASVSANCVTGDTWNGSSCAINTYTVTGLSGTGGSISPSTRTVNYGSTTTFTITPNSGYTASAFGCNGTPTTPQTSTYTFTTGAITSDCTVSANFSTNPVPDLTAFVSSPTAATINVAQTYSATVSNIGGASTGSSFSNFWQKATAASGGGTVTDLASSSMNVLAAGGSATSTSPSITFTSGGTYSIRVCADKSSSGSSGSISESDEGNNCGPWTNVTAGTGGTCSNGATNPPTCDNGGGGGMSGSLTPSASSCIIAAGASSCTVNLSWNVINPVVVGGTAVTSDTNNSGASSPNFSVAPPVSSGTVDNGTKANVVIPYNSRTFYLYNNAALLATSNLFSSCISGTTWNGSTCATVVVPPPSTCGNGTIDAGESCDNGALNSNYCPSTCTKSCVTVNPCRKKPVTIEE